VFHFLALRPAPVQSAADQAGLKVNMPAQHQVLEHGHMFEQLNILEGTSDPQACPLVRCHTGDFPFFEGDLAITRPVQAADAV
jgi:hypothetical protein